MLDYKADTASLTLLYSYDELKYGPPWTPAVQILGGGGPDPLNPPVDAPMLKTHLFHKSFLHSHSYSFRADFMDLTLYWIKGALLCLF